MRARKHGGCPNNDGTRINQGYGQFPYIGYSQVELLDFHASFHEGCNKIIHHLLRALVHGHIG